VNRIVVGPEISAELKRSRRRRSIGIKVHRGEVVVSAPFRAPLEEIRAFVTQKARWIEKHLVHQRQSLQQQPQRPQAGGTLQFLGRPLQLVSVPGLRGARFVADRLELGGDAARHGDLIARWLAQQAAAYLPGRVQAFAPLVGVQPRALGVRYYKSRWGSCNTRGELQFNWMLLMAPPEVVDYVVVHELAHLRHFNHSPAFWQLVEQVMPDYARHRAWLKQQMIPAW
jgi:predicted metal-dependent hydrolase